MDLSKLHLHWGSCKRGRKVHKSYSLARAYRENGKNRKELVLKLGKLSDEDVEKWRITLKAFKDPLTYDPARPVIEHNHNYLEIAVLLEIWNFWELSSIFDQESKKNQRTVSLSCLAILLTINRCVDPRTKSQVPTWYKKTALPFLLQAPTSEINPSRIFRELDFIEKCKDPIAQHLCKKMKESDPEAMKFLFYDLSTTTFTGSRCLLMHWGHCKEGYENHIVLALIVNTKGFPLYWEVLEGGTADATTISWLLNRLQEKLPIAIPTMVFDRGMVSEDNLILLENNKIKYITAMDKNQIEEIVKMDFLPFEKMNIDDVDSQMSTSGFNKLDDTTYCKEICEKNERRFVLCFNAQLCKDQRKAREEQIGIFESFVEEQNKELLQAKKDRDKASTKQKFDTWLSKAKIGFIDIELEEKYVPKQTRKMLKAILSYQAKIFVDETKKQQAGRLDGFWLLVTNHSEKNEKDFIQTTEAVVRPYREKVIIESSFRDIKSFVEISPVHVWKPDHVKAHYTICVLAHLLNRTLSMLLQENIGRETSDVISHGRLYEELDECRLNYSKTCSTKGFYSFTKPTIRQKELLKRLKMEKLIGTTALDSISSSSSYV